MSISTIPKDPKVYNRLFLDYKNDIFWKIMNKKDSLPPIGNVKEMQADAATAARTAAIAAQMGADTHNKKAEGSMIQNQQLLIMQA